MKKRLLLIPLASMLLSSCFRFGCGFVDDTETHGYTKELQIVNRAEDDYYIAGDKLAVHYFNEYEDVPYVRLRDFLYAFRGYFDYGNFSYETNQGDDIFTLYYRKSHPIVFNSNNNKIWAASYYEFLWCSAAASSTNYNEHLERTNDFYDRDATFEIDLDDYGFEVREGNQIVWLPLFVLNTLFCAMGGLNLFYNGSSIFVTVGEVRNLPEYYNCRDNKKPQTKSMREAAVNSLCFTFDVLYGLKEEKGYEHFADYLDKDTLEKLYSTDSSENYSAYKDIVYKQLDELHTRLDLPSYYCDPDLAKVTRDDFGDFYSEFHERRDVLKELRGSIITNTEEVRFEGDMAIITLDSFDVGMISQIYDKDGNVKEDAWKYDSYHYMHHCMNQIENHGGINKVVLDLSLNGGGSLAAMEKVAGFMTDEKIPLSTYDTLDNEFVTDSYVVDIDGDGDFEDHDAYDEYDWYLLTGINTFSAANLMSSTFKDMNLGKIIGKKSGGGTCSILSLVLADGTGITISSTYTMRHVEEKENGDKDFVSIEHGIEPDIDFAYENFYDSEALLNAINSSSIA